MKNSYINYLRNGVSIVIFLLMMWTVSSSYAQGSGKIWYSEGKIYVNVPNKGVLVVDDANPMAPQKLGFIEIPGNVDLAIQGETLFANNFDDLVSIDISKLSKPKVLSRVDGVFPHRGSNDGVASQKIQWEVRNRMPSLDELSARSDIEINSSDMPTMNNGNGNTGASQGGSMSCFAIKGNHLYAINNEDLNIFDISNPKKLNKTSNRVEVGEGIETVFSNRENLFIGSQTGMYIYNLDDPTEPERVSKYEHVRACDPVVVEGKYAYITLRNGTQCNRSVNELDVVDISDLEHPRKVKSYRMTNPHGLGIDNGLLFICDGRDGLKVFNADNPHSVRQVKHFRDIQTFDVIPVAERKILIMSGSNKICQYDYSNKNEIELLSEFGVD